MKASELFRTVKNDLETLSEYTSHVERKLQDTDKRSISSIMTWYNYDNLVEILSRDDNDLDFEIDDSKLQDFQLHIGHYLDTYAPGESDLKVYITGISVYLAFIAKRPLHPPGLESGNGPHIVKNGNSYYCSGKRLFINDDKSLCKYCVCKQLF